MLDEDVDGLQFIHHIHSLASVVVEYKALCLCVYVSACASSISIWRRRKGEQGQTGGRACNGQRKWKARGRMTKPCIFFFLLPPHFFFYCILESSSRTFRRVEKGVVLSFPKQICIGKIRFPILVIESEEK